MRAPVFPSLDDIYCIAVQNDLSCPNKNRTLLRGMEEGEGEGRRGSSDAEERDRVGVGYKELWVEDSVEINLRAIARLHTVQLKTSVIAEYYAIEKENDWLILSNSIQTDKFNIPTQSFFFYWYEFSPETSRNERSLFLCRPGGCVELSFWRVHFGSNNWWPTKCK